MESRVRHESDKERKLKTIDIEFLPFSPFFSLFLPFPLEKFFGQARITLVIALASGKDRASR